MPRDDRIKTRWRFLGPVDSASSLDAGVSDFDSDLYTEAIFVECYVRINCDADWAKIWVKEKVDGRVI